MLDVAFQNLAFIYFFKFISSGHHDQARQWVASNELLAKIACNYYCKQLPPYTWQYFQAISCRVADKSRICAILVALLQRKERRHV